MSSTTPVYNPNIPIRKDLFNKSQGDFLVNFQTLYDAFAANHVPLDAGSTAGNHTFIQLLEQSTQFQTGAGEISVYTKNIPGQTDQIFLRYQGNQTEFAYTVYQIFKIESTTSQTSFFTFLPGRILLYFGTIIPSAFTLPDETFKLDLIPPIAKTIISANFCPIGIAALNVPLYPPIANPSSSIPGFITELLLEASFSLPSINIPPCYYMIMVNI